MKMKRFFTLVVAMLLLVLYMTTTAMADGESNWSSAYYPNVYPYMTPSVYPNQYPYTTQAPSLMEEYIILTNDTRLYQDFNCNYQIGSLNFGEKVYVQAKYNQVAYVMYVSGNMVKYAYLENAKLAKPIKKIRLSGHCYLSPNHNANYDDKTTFSSAMGGDRVKEDAFVLAEVDSHYLIITDEGRSGWISKQYSEFSEIESYSNGNSIDLNYYYYYYGAQYQFEANYCYTLRPNLALRKKASISSGSNGKLKIGTEVEVLESNGEWCKVQAGGTTGYLKKAFLGILQKKIKISGETYLAPVPGMHEYNYSSAICGIVSNTEAMVFATYGEYYQIVTSEGHCGFVYMYDPNIQIIEELSNG